MVNKVSHWGKPAVKTNLSLIFLFSIHVFNRTSFLSSLFIFILNVKTLIMNDKQCMFTSKHLHGYPCQNISHHFSYMYYLIFFWWSGKTNLFKAKYWLSKVMYRFKCFKNQVGVMMPDMHILLIISYCCPYLVQQLKSDHVLYDSNFQLRGCCQSC